MKCNFILLSLNKKVWGTSAHSQRSRRWAWLGDGWKPPPGPQTLGTTGQKRYEMVQAQKPAASDKNELKRQVPQVSLSFTVVSAVMRGQQTHLPLRPGYKAQG